MRIRTLPLLILYNYTYTTPLPINKQQPRLTRTYPEVRSGETVLMQSITSRNGNIIEDLNKAQHPDVEDASGTSAFDLVEGKPWIIDRLRPDVKKQIIERKASIKHFSLSCCQPQSVDAHIERISAGIDEQTMNEAYLVNLREEDPFFKGCGNALNNNRTPHGIFSPEMIPVFRLEQRERLLAKTHTSLYHAHSGSDRLMHDFLTQLWAFEHQRPQPTHFIMQRFWHDKHVLSNSRPQRFFKETGLDASRVGVWGVDGTSDAEDNIKRHLISCNISLWGNFYTTQECTFRFYLLNGRKTTDTREQMRKIFSFYDFDPAYLNVLASVNTHVMQNRGELLQIFIPHNIVDQCAYISKPQGLPHNEHYDVSRSDYAKKYVGNSIQKVTEGIRTSQLDADDTLQARIILGTDYMLNPDSGIIIARESDLPPQKIAWYRKTLHQVTAHLFINWLERVLDRSISDEVLRRIAHTPLGKMVKDRDHEKITRLIEQLRKCTATIN